MCAIDLLNAMGAAQDAYILDACFAEKRKVGRGRLWLLAIAAALLLLLAGCAAWLLRLDQRILVDHQGEAGLFVAEKVLSVQGYEGSPAYNALQEWLAYETDYIRQNPECRFESTFQRGPEYQIYACYSQEMVDKVDELCEKYGLHVVGQSTFLMGESEVAANGLGGILTQSPRDICGDLFADGSFVADGEITLTGTDHETVQFQMQSIRKDAFYTGAIGIHALSDFTQWTYKAKDGTPLLLVLNSRTGMIFAETDERFISIIIEEVPDADMVFDGLPMEKNFLEAVSSCFCYDKGK